MTNPARDLHALLSKWAIVPNGSSISSTRGGGFSKEQVHACGLLADVSLAINRLTAAGEDMTAFETFVPKWWTALMLPTDQWTERTRGDREVISAETLATLAALAAYLDKVHEPAFTATADSTQHVRDALQELVTLLSSDEMPIGREGRIYVFTLVDELRTVFDAAQAHIDFDVVRRIHQLQGYLTVVANDLEARDASHPLVVRLRQFVRRATPVAVPLAGAVGYMTGMAANAVTIAAAITSG